jgi:hypothetical protein
MLTQERLKELLEYNPETGQFIRKKQIHGHHIGDVAGTIKANGYSYIGVDGKQYRAHRLAWFYTHGKWPAEHIDHINRIPTDNRLCNLREATMSQNMQNRGALKSNAVGLKGVMKRCRKYLSTIRIDGKSVKIGSFNTAEEAHAAYCKAAEELHKEFVNYG